MLPWHAGGSVDDNVQHARREGVLRNQGRSRHAPTTPPLPTACFASRAIHKPLGELIGGNRAKFLLEWWTNWPAYVVAVAAGGCWYNLDGGEAGPITEEQQRGVVGRMSRAKMTDLFRPIPKTHRCNLVCSLLIKPLARCWPKRGRNMATEPKPARNEDPGYLLAMGQALISTGRKHADLPMIRRGMAKLQRLPPEMQAALKPPTK
jgi:hypothetical protein